jgi:dethiobiotin synthetase
MKITRGIFFIAGTDTGVGKTWWTTTLLREANKAGIRSLGLKPVAAGAVRTAAGWRNDDALALQAASSLALPYEDINPVCLPLATSPHLAARSAGVAIDVCALANSVRATALQAELVLVEGAGGWLTPLDDRQTLADFAHQLAAPVILVVGLRLGCLNHAQLTANAIRDSGLPLAGWIANELANDHGDRSAQIEFLTRRLGQPPLGIGGRLSP